MANEKIRKTLRFYNVRMWQLADLLEMPESTFYQKMRREWPEEEQQRIIDMIKDKYASSNEPMPE